MHSSVVQLQVARSLLFSMQAHGWAECFVHCLDISSELVTRYVSGGLHTTILGIDLTTHMHSHAVVQRQ